MFKSKWIMALALAACAFLLVTPVNAKNKVTKPFKIQGTAIVQILSVTPPPGALFCTLAKETGEATHLGKYQAEGNGVFTLSSTGSSQGHYAKSIYTAANGDEMWVEADIYDVNTDAVAGTCAFKMKAKIIGGTGRFDGATGELDELSAIGDYDTAKGIIKFSYRASGTITF